MQFSLHSDTLNPVPTSVATPFAKPAIMAARARKVKPTIGDRTYIPSTDITKDLPISIDTLTLDPSRNGGQSGPSKRSHQAAPVVPHDPTVSSSSKSGMSSAPCRLQYRSLPNPSFGISQPYHCSLQTLDPRHIRPQRAFFPHRDNSFE